MDEENQINDKLKIMKFSLLPYSLEHTPFYFIFSKDFLDFYVKIPKIIVYLKT